MVLAGVPKLLAPDDFAEVVGAYGLVPDMLVFPAAVVLPLAELLAAFLLIRGKRSGLWLAAALMLLFITVLSYGIWLGLDIDCGCFGPEDIEHKAFSGLRTALARDMLLCLPLLYCFWYTYRFPYTQCGEYP